MGFAVNQTVTITTGAAQVWWSTGLQASGATSLAHDDDTATNLSLTIVDSGGTLLDNSASLSTASASPHTLKGARAACRSVLKSSDVLTWERSLRGFLSLRLTFFTFFLFFALRRSTPWRSISPRFFMRALP